MTKTYYASAAASVAGLIFGSGLILAGMVNPAKILAFLDLTGQWDPSLTLVMAGAIAVGFIAFTIAKKRPRSLLGLTIHLPASNLINRRLILGSLTFGVGWGLAGICPGPAIVLLGTGNLKGAIFFFAMLAGMAIFEWLENRFSPSKQPE